MFLVWVYKRNSEQATIGRRNELVTWLLPYWIDTYHVLLTVSLCVRVVTEVMVGQCDGPVLATANAPACNYFQDTNSIQPAYMISLMILPLLAYVVVRETSVISIALSWLASTATLTWCAVYLRSRLLVPVIALSLFAQVLIYYDAKRQNDDMICLVAALRTTAAENERLQEEARASELRAMIGNVAHDLKTVGTPFSPVETILSQIFLTHALFSILFPYRSRSLRCSAGSR
jgi:signal transduction histidine kinase